MLSQMAFVWQNLPAVMLLIATRQGVLVVQCLASSATVARMVRHACLRVAVQSIELCVVVNAVAWERVVVVADAVHQAPTVAVTHAVQRTSPVAVTRAVVYSRHRVRLHRRLHPIIVFLGEHHAAPSVVRPAWSAAAIPPNSEQTARHRASINVRCVRILSLDCSSFILSILGVAEGRRASRRLTTNRGQSK